MNHIEIKPALSPRERNIFITFPWRVYKDDPFWVPPLISERKKSIDPSRGVWYKQGSADFFIAWQDGRPVGTICAAEDRQSNATLGKRDCVFGFFEYIEDYQVFTALLEQVMAWAQGHHLDSLLGPFNLDYEDAYGVLIEGHDRPPAILCGHSPPYYQNFMERMGFIPARGDNLAYALDLSNTFAVQTRLDQMASLVQSRKDFTIRQADFAHWREEVDRVLELINPSLQHLNGFIPWTRENLQKLMEPFVRIANPQLILFAEKDGQPIGFFPAVPNMNEVVIHLNGLRYPWDYVKAARYMRIKPQSASIKSVLVLPEYWRSGVIILLIREMVRRLVDCGYTWVDLSLTSDDNPNTPILAEHMGAKIYKRYRVYRKAL